MTRTSRALGSLVLLAPIAAAAPAAAQATRAAMRHQALDQILEVQVRDGDVYYRALQQSRAALDGYVASLDVPAAALEAWSREDRLAFWLNAYNAFVLQTVVDRYPIHGRAKEYPAESIRQIAGAFDKRTFRAAGRRVTLDDIEKHILPEFSDPRVYFALGMGAAGSGRLRSEAYDGARLEAQLAEATREFLAAQDHVAIDRNLNELQISAIIGWHEAEFAAAFAGGADARFAARSPVERAVLALLWPGLYPSERQFLERNEFRVRYKTFDWRLNDLTGGRR